MRSHSYLWTGLRHCSVPCRWGGETTTDRVKTDVQESTSCISHISGTNSIANVNVVLFACTHLRMKLFLVLVMPHRICSRLMYADGAVSARAHSLHARKESSLLPAWSYHEYINSHQ